MKETTVFFILTTILMLLAAVWILPKIVEWINREEAHFIISGFQDLSQQEEKEEHSSSSQGSLSPSPPPVKTSPFFLSGVCNGIPCPEGTFCDDVSQSCISLSPPGTAPDTGYFS